MIPDERFHTECCVDYYITNSCGIYCSLRLAPRCLASTIVVLFLNNADTAIVAVDVPTHSHLGVCLAVCVSEAVALLN